MWPEISDAAIRLLNQIFGGDLPREPLALYQVAARAVLVYLVGVIAVAHRQEPRNRAANRDRYHLGIHSRITLEPRHHRPCVALRDGRRFRGAGGERTG